MNVQLIFYVVNGDLMWHTKATPYHTSNSQHIHSHAKHFHPSPTIISLWPIQRLINPIISPHVTWSCKNLYPGVATWWLWWLMICLWATHQQPTITKKWVVTGNHMCNARLQWVCKMSELQHNIMRVQNQFSLIVEQCFCYKEVWWSCPGTHLVTNHESQSRTSKLQLKRNITSPKLKLLPGPCVTRQLMWRQTPKLCITVHWNSIIVPSFKYTKD